MKKRRPLLVTIISSIDDLSLFHDYLISLDDSPMRLVFPLKSSNVYHSSFPLLKKKSPIHAPLQ
ncbi:hypothetical protein ACFLQ0_06740, partial [Nitrospinota bacterium]